MRTGCAALAVLGCALAALAATPARAQAQLPLPPLPIPVLQRVLVIAPPGEPLAPKPTGKITITIDGLDVMTRPVADTSDLLLATASAAAALGQNVTLTYSGDDYYEPGEPVRVKFLGGPTLTITARSRDSAPPVIEILSPGDGVRYAVAASVTAIYSCKDPGERSAVARCEGPVTAGAAVDTATAGPYSFTVTAADARGNTSTKTITFRVGETGAAAGDRSREQRGGAQPTPDPPPARPAAGAPGAVSPPASAATPGSEPRLGSSSAPRSSGQGNESAGAPPQPASGSDDEDPAQPLSRELTAYDPRSNPAQTVGILVAAFTLLHLGTRAGGLALAGGGGGVGGSAAESTRRRRLRSGRSGHGDSTPEASFDYEAVEVEQLAGGAAAVAAGDRSRTWGWMGTRTVDAIGVALPARLARRSPLLARVAADGTYLRAILGSASLLGPLAGIALGIAAVRDVGGDAIPPAATLAIAIAALGVLDATAGLVAVLIFTIGVLALGGIDSNADVRLMLGLGALWFVVPVLAGAVRPLRREPARGPEEAWDRAADFVIGSLIGAWAVQKIVLALPGLAGMQLSLTDHANSAAYAVLAALVVRLGLETVAAHLYPRRLDVAEPGELPEPSATLRLGATALRLLVFVFFANIVVGGSWQLWVGAALFVVPQIVAVYQERVPNSPGLYRALPKGLVELVLMIIVGTAVGALLISTMDENADTFIANSFVLLALPGFVLSLLALFGRDGDDRQVGWGKRVAGVALLVLGVLAVFGLVL